MNPPPLGQPGTSAGMFTVYLNPEGMKALADGRGAPVSLWGWYFNVQPAGEAPSSSHHAITTFEAVLPTLEHATVAAIAEIDKRIKTTYAEADDRIIDLRSQRDKLHASTMSEGG